MNPSDPDRENDPGAATRIDWHTGVPLARGGSGEVVRAWSPDLEREIAIKYLRVEEPAAIERMLREARTQAGFDHPHILPVHATGTHLGRHYIAMDVVDGQPLDLALAGADPDARLRVFDQVLDAMDCAHRAGVVHRDLKPANLMVEDRDGEPYAWVMDFGLARRPEDATLTVAGDALGTPGYMAPEQARGSEGADPCSDVYALGVVLYQLLTGKLPYTGETPMALVMQAASGETVSVTEIRRRLPDGLARIVMCCLESDPARRYRDAGALRRDLREFRAGGTVEAPVLGRRYRIRRWARINPWRARLAAALALVVVGGTGALALIADQNRRALAEASGLIAEAERARGDWYVDQLLPLHDQRPAEQNARDTLARLESAKAGLTDAATARIDAALADLLDAIGEPGRAFESARDAWRGGVRTPAVAMRAVRARLQQFGASRLDLALTAAPTALAGLISLERQSLVDDLSRFRGAIDSALQARLDRELADEPVARVSAETVPATAAEWQGRLLDLQPAAASAIERLNSEGASGLDELDRVSEALDALVDSVRSYRPAYRLGCQIEAARQSMRTMQAGESTASVPREFCDRGLMLDPGDPDLLAVSSMQFWQRAKDLRRNRMPFDAELARAIDQARSALDAEPGNELAQLSLGSALQVRGRQRLAAGEDPDPALAASLEWLERVHQSRPNDVNVMNNLAVTWNTISAARSGAGNTRGAIEADGQSLRWLELAAETAPDDRRLVHNMLLAKMSLGYQASLLGDDPDPALESAAEALRALIDAHPEYVGPLNTLGLVRWTQGVWEARIGEDAGPAMRAAEAAFERALDIRPDWESARINLAGVLRQWYTLAQERPGEEIERRADAAISIYRELEPVEGEKSEFDCLRAEILAARAGWRSGETARELLDRAERLSVLDNNIGWTHVDCRRARARIGSVLRDLGENDGLANALWAETRDAVEDSQDPDLLIHAARFAASMDRDDLLRQWMRRVPAPFREAASLRQSED